MRNEYDRFSSTSLFIGFAINFVWYELFSFREVKSEAGHTSYKSKGAHDDTVMGLAMAVRFINLMQEFDDYIGAERNVVPKNIPKTDLHAELNNNPDKNESFQNNVPIRPKRKV